MATPGQLQMFNKVETHEMFGLDHRAFDPRIQSLRRIQVYDDEKVPHAATFKIWLEDHTLGNILRMELLRNETVLFAGYKVPHPLDNMIEMRVQTMNKSNPETALRAAVANLRTESRSMLEQFDKGVAALSKGEKHHPEVPSNDRRGPPPPPGAEDATSEVDMQSPGHGAGGTSDDMAQARRTDPMDEDQAQDAAFRDEMTQLQKLEAFDRGGAEGYQRSPSYSPTSPHQEGQGQPGLTPGLTPAPEPGSTPGLTPGATPGLTPGPGATPGLTPGPGGDGDVDMD